MEFPTAQPATVPAVKKKAPHVIIMGAGCTGLLLAQGLKKAGVSFDIFEADTSLTRSNAREWGMTIHWSRTLLESILPVELLERLNEAQVDPAYHSSSGAGYTVPFYNGKTGEHIIAIPMVDGVRVSRSKFRKLLSEGISIKFGENIASYTIDGDEITSNFESGRTATGTLLVGTDGPKSAVRSILLGNEAAAVKRLPVVMYNLTVCYEDAARARHIRHLHPMNTMALHPVKSLSLWTSIQDASDPEAPETWKFQLAPTWLDDGKEHFGGAEGLEKLREIAKSMAEPWKSSILWIPEGTEVPPPSNVAYWPTVAWDNKNGLITLAGDAAHPLPPHRGQGLNHCIQDIANLLTAILSFSPSNSGESSESRSTDTQASAISAYDAELVKRGGEEVENSRKNSMLIHDFEKFMDSPVFKQGYARTKYAGGVVRCPPPGQEWSSAQETECEKEIEKKAESANRSKVEKEKGGEEDEEKGEKGDKRKSTTLLAEEQKAHSELMLMKEYTRKVHEMSVAERLEAQKNLVGEIEGLSRLMGEKSRELSEIMKVL